MRRSAAFFAIAAVLPAADFWTAKPYTEWSDKEAAKLLSASPWAHAVAIGSPLASSAGPGSRPGAAPRLATPDSSGGPGPMDEIGAIPTGTRRPDDPPSPNAGPGAESIRVVVRWQSALPVREALLVRKGRSNLISPEDARRILETDESHYVIAIAGLAMRLPLGEAGRAAKESIRQSASLRRKGQDPIAAERVEILQRAGGVDVFLLFPKSSPIVLEDREVEVVASAGAGEIRAKFKLKDMTIAGKLAL